MKKYALLYGAAAGAVVIAVISLGLFLDLPSHFQSALFGYAVMLVALSLIFVGVKRYRDVERGGVIRFGPALGLGAAIAAVAGLIYVIGWEIVLAGSGIDFMADYQARMLADMQASGASAQEMAETRATMEVWGERYRSPLWRMPITFVEIFPVGLLVALVSAALLRNPRLLPARR